MKVKLDENLPVGLIDDFTHSGHEPETVYSEGLSGADDLAIWQRAQSEQRMLITMDLDFSDVRRYAPGTHMGVLLLRPHRDGRQAIIDLMRRVLQRESLDDLAGCLAVADESHTRVRRA